MQDDSGRYQFSIQSQLAARNTSPLVLTRDAGFVNHTQPAQIDSKLENEAGYATGNESQDSDQNPILSGTNASNYKPAATNYSNSVENASPLTTKQPEPDLVTYQKD